MDPRRVEVQADSEPEPRAEDDLVLAGRVVEAPQVELHHLIKRRGSLRFLQAGAGAVPLLVAGRDPQRRVAERPRLLEARREAQVTAAVVILPESCGEPGKVRVRVATVVGSPA